LAIALCSTQEEL